MCAICGYDMSLEINILWFTTHIYCMGVIIQTFVICQNNICHLKLVKLKNHFNIVMMMIMMIILMCT
jgi:hypothetical protein